MGADSGNGAGNALGFRHGVINGVPQFAQKIFQVIVELQSGPPYQWVNPFYG
jgi:hypothetical protein